MDFVKGVVGMAQSAWNHDLAEQSAERQYERQLDFWNMQNEYNSPSNQRKRMQDAGMSPVDAVQSQLAGELSSVPGNEFAQQGTFNFVEHLKTFSEMEKLGAESDLLAQELKIAYIREAVESGKLLGVDLDNKQKSILLKYLDKREQWTIESLIAEVENTKQDTATSSALEGKYKSESSAIDTKLPYEVGSLEAGISEKVAHTGKLLAEESYIKAKEITENELRQYEKEYKSASTYELKSQSSLNYAMARVNNINADLQAKYGDRSMLAETLTKESAAQYADDLNMSIIELRKTASELNRDNIRHNSATEALQKEANEIRAQFNKLYGVGVISQSMFKMLDASMGSLDDILNLIN